MDKTVARLNIEHYRKSLAAERDEAKRQTLMRLLAEEQAKVAALDTAREKTAQPLALLLPLAPMRGPHVDACFSLGVDPTAEDAGDRRDGQRSLAQRISLKRKVQRGCGGPAPRDKEIPKRGRPQPRR